MYIKQLHHLVHFLWMKGNLAKDIHEDTFPVYSVRSLLHKAVNWVGKFKGGHSKLEDLSAQIP